jgi:hypothetical protein
MLLAASMILGDVADFVIVRIYPIDAPPVIERRSGA